MEIFNRRGRPIKPASEISFSNTYSGLTAKEVQAALDELYTLIGTGGVVLELKNLDDVDSTLAPTDGQVLTYDFANTQWIAADPTGGVGGGVTSIAAGTGISVNSSNPAIPVVSVSAGTSSALALALSALQSGDVAAVALSGAYADLTGKPTIPTIPKDTRGATFVSSSGALTSGVDPVAVYVPYDCTITGVVVLTRGGTGSCVVDIRKDTYGNYPPDSGDSICASAKPTVSSGIKSKDTTLTGWTTSLSADDVLLFVLESTSTFTSVQIVLILQPT